MTPRSLLWALALLGGLIGLYVTTLAFNWFDCVIELSFGQLSGFETGEVIRRECTERALFPFSSL